MGLRGCSYIQAPADTGPCNVPDQSDLMRVRVGRDRAHLVANSSCGVEQSDVQWWIVHKVRGAAMII